MNKIELYEEVKNLVYGDKQLTISSKFKYGENFGYEVVGNAIILTITTYEDIRIFRRLIKENESKSPSFDGLDYLSSLELLFFHYQYGHTNGSNCILVNEYNDILAINYNGLSDTSEIISTQLKFPGYVVFNNRKKIGENIKANQLEEYREVFNRLLIQIKTEDSKKIKQF